MWVWQFLPKTAYIAGQSSWQLNGLINRVSRVRAPLPQSEYQLVEEAIFQAGYRIIKKPPHALVAQWQRNALVMRRFGVQVPAGAFKIHPATLFCLMDSLEVKRQVESLKIRRSNRPPPTRRYLVKMIRHTQQIILVKKIVCKTRLKRFKSLNMPCKI